MSWLTRPYTPNDWKELTPMIEAWPFKPFGKLNHFQQSKLIAFTCDEVLKTLTREQCGACIAVHKNELRGFGCFNLLPWDTKQLGMPAARIDFLVADGPYDEQRHIKEVLVKRLLDRVEALGIRHLSVRIDASDFSSLHALEAAGFNTIDTILTFAIDLTKEKLVAPNHDFKLRLATADDAEQVAALARIAFVYDRFHADPAICSERSDELHATWLRDSCYGKSADIVVLAEDKEGLLGFATGRINRDTQELGSLVGTILIAASAERSRGRGVAHSTMIAVAEWMHQQGCLVIEGGTQVRNIPSARLFRRCGFVMVGASYSLRKMCSINGTLYF